MKNLKFIFTLLIAIFVILIKSYAEDLESTNFKIKGDLINGGVPKAESTNYEITNDINPFSDFAESTSFKEKVGYNPRLQANTPYTPTLENSANYYDKLRIIVDTASNPDDTLFAIAMTENDWTTVKYVKATGELDTTLEITDYRTYTNWGGGSGTLVLGLYPNTGYKAMVKALQGDFTETGYSPSTEEVKTGVPSITLEVSDTVTALGVLNTSSVNESSTVSLTVNTNAGSGYQLSVQGTGNTINGGLYNGTSYLIQSQDATLSAGTEGYGAQASSLTATIETKYDKAGFAVGAVDVSNNFLASNDGPVTDDTVSVVLKAAISGITEAGEYTDTIYYTISPTL